MKRLVFILSFLIVILMAASLFAEEVRLVTYYPSPQGVYSELRSHRMAIGENFYNTSQYGWDSALPNEIDGTISLVIEEDVSIGRDNTMRGKPGPTDWRILGVYGQGNNYGMLELGRSTTSDGSILGSIIFTQGDATGGVQEERAEIQGIRKERDGSIAGDIVFLNARPSQFPLELMRITRFNTQGYVGFNTQDPSARIDIKTASASNDGVAIMPGNNVAIRLANNTGTPFIEFMRGNSVNSTMRIIQNADDRLVVTKRVPESGAATLRVGTNVTTNPGILEVHGPIFANLTETAAAKRPMVYDTGTGELQIAPGSDLAEIFISNQEVEIADVLIIDKDGNLTKSFEPNDSRVAGIVSAAPAIVFEGSQLQIAPEPFKFTKGTKPPVALAGRVLVKATAENGPIEPGDLLTTSSKPGHAMKSLERLPGTILGKALGTLEKGDGMVMALVTLQ